MILFTCWLSFVDSVSLILYVWLDCYKNLAEISRFTKPFGIRSSTECIHRLDSFFNRYERKDRKEYKRLSIILSIGCVLYLVFHATFCICFVRFDGSNVDFAHRLFCAIRCCIAFVIPLFGYVIYFLLKNGYKDMKEVFVFHVITNLKNFDLQDIFEGLEKNKDEWEKYGIKYFYNKDDIEGQYRKIVDDKTDIWVNAGKYRFNLTVEDDNGPKKTR